MDLFGWIIVGFIAIVVIMTGAVLLGEYEKKKAMQDSEKQFDFNTTHEYGDFKVDENTLRFIVSYYTGTSRAYHISEVSDWELVEDGQRYKSDNGVLRAVVGGALFGGTGAVVGATTANRTSSVRSLQVNIYTTDLDTPIVVVYCLHNQPGQYTNTNSIIYSNACNTAHSIMAVLQSMKLRYDNGSKNMVLEKRNRLRSNNQTQDVFPEKENLPDDYVVFGVEMTGVEPDESEIIEIALVRVVNRKPKNWYTRLIKPKVPIADEITLLSGITNDMLVDKPYIEEVIDEILDFIGDSVIIGDAIGYRIGFLAANSSRVLTNKTINAGLYAQLKIKDLERYTFQNVAAYLNVKDTDHARLLNDCLVVQKCFEILRERDLE